jgi:hypothetical protein
VGTTSFANAQNESNNFINTIWKIPNSKQIDDTQKEEIPIISNEQGGVFDDAKVKIVLLNSIEFIGDSCIKTSFNYKSIESETYFYKRFPLKNSTNIDSSTSYFYNLINVYVSLKSIKLIVV